LGEGGAEDAVAEAEEGGAFGEGEVAESEVVEFGADDGGVLGVVADVEGDDGGEAGARGFPSIGKGDVGRWGEAEVESGEDEVEGAGAGAEDEGGGEGALVEAVFGFVEEESEDEGEGQQEAEGADEEGGLQGVLTQVAGGEVDGRREGAHWAWRSSRLRWKG
jgi:hypothetical protein